ncbi:hypothetical protein PC118_g5486 [Phytophthora cactorum]|uniref:Uncharacterized protein n=1 Tax=Phytophthora cactorum TaxID=29920 RepID=A0A8T1GGF8_9STRA|nr:hypothetical protein PC118_g5486 [Phytophthora cactorum]
MQSTPTPTSDASTDRSQSPEHHAVKKRKPTYLIRKEEEKALRDEVLKLEAQVASLQTKRIPVAASMQQVAAESKVLREVTRNQQLGVAAAQSLVLECAWTQYSHPLCPTIATFAMSDDSTACWSPAQPTAKKRKPTYLVRKEEEQSLKDEILQLQAKVAVLKTQGMPTGSAIAADPSLQESTAKWKVLTNTIKNQQLGVAEAQSLAMECTRTQPCVKFCTPTAGMIVDYLLLKPTNWICFHLQEEEKTLRDEILQLEAQVIVLQPQGMPAGAAVAATATSQSQVEGADRRCEAAGIGRCSSSVAHDRVHGEGK